jgi:hypothetical protein
MKIFSDLTIQEKKVLAGWALVGIAVFILVILFSFVYVERKKESGNGEADKNYNLVYDHSRYYTVLSALDKYYSFVNASNEKALMKILDARYVKEKKITEDNVLDYVKYSDIIVTFDPGLMCQKNNADGTVNYLVKVTDKPYFTISGDDETIIEDKNLTDEYYRIVLDGNDSSFSVTPISKKEHGDACNG